jgi:hypothetical protein
MPNSKSLRAIQETVGQTLGSAAGAVRLASPLANSTTSGSDRANSTPSKIDGFSGRDVDRRIISHFPSGA